MLGRIMKKKVGLPLAVWLLAFIFLAPLYIVFINSWKTLKGLFLYPLRLPCGEFFSPGNYIEAFTRLDFIPAFMNSLFITVASTAVIIIFTSSAAWMLVRTKSKTSTVIFFMFAGAMLIPFQAVMLPLVALMGRLNFLNPPGLIFMYLGFGSSLSIILFHGFIKNIPKEMEEAATIDGCNKLQVFWYVVFPLLKPITATVSILNAMWIWNDFLLPHLVIHRPEWHTIPLRMFFFFGEFARQWHLGLAGLIMAMVPIIVFYVFAQRYIVKGLTEGSIK